MSTLFSPVGTADPITQLGDGPMLHIVRHMSPDRVVLYLSPEMRESQDRDGRYTDAIERLCAAEGRPVPEIKLVDALSVEVYRFDRFIEEFEGILRGLCDESPEGPVLVNVTSGTPGWQQALVALGSFGQLRLRLLQVTTPRRGINKRQDREKLREYDPEGMWELNEMLREEEPESRESRIIEVATPNFSERLLRANLVTLLEDYEYEAAYDLAMQSATMDEGTRQMIRAAADRVNLVGGLPAKVFGGSAVSCRPNDPLSEYLSVMEVRLSQGHWADFVRMLTPALTQLCKDVLRRSGVPEQAYLRTDYNRQADVFDWQAIDGDERLSRLFGADSQRRPSSPTNWLMTRAAVEACDDMAVAKKIKQLRGLEENCRNKIAHELRASDRDTLERIGGIKLDVALRYLFELHGNMRPHLYADASRLIIDRL